jgi:hypothetical protein
MVDDTTRVALILALLAEGVDVSALERVFGNREGTTDIYDVNNPMLDHLYDKRSNHQVELGCILKLSRRV